MAEPTSERKPNITLFVLLGVVAIALVAVVVGLVGGGDDDDSSDVATASGTEARNVEFEGDPLAKHASDADDPTVGTPAPVLFGQTFAGDEITIPTAGTPAVVVFLAHWCPHCQREVPFLVSYFDLNGLPSDVDVFGVATSIDPAAPNYPPSEWLEREEWTIPTLVDAEDNGAASVFGLGAFPYFVAIDADGNVAARASGELEAPQLEALFEAARGG
jgi:thiol-disulfide isomerase/thioredoxin